MTELLPPPIAASCDRHRTLVASALAEDADDEVLSRYAEVVPGCPDCRRALAARLSLDPALLARPADEADARAELRHAPAHRRRRLLERGGAALAAAATLGWVVFHATPLTAQAPATAPSPVPAASPRPIPPAPEETRSPAPSAPSPPARARMPTPTSTPSPPRGPGADDALADAAPHVETSGAEDDWPPPEFVDLTGTQRKGGLGGGSVPSARLVVTGEASVGGTSGLLVVSSAPTDLTVCVDGPERGVVWRGRVPAGRTDLTRGGRLVAYAWTTPGSYRFLVSTGSSVGCVEPQQVVAVELAP